MEDDQALNWGERVRREVRELLAGLPREEALSRLMDIVGDDRLDNEIELLEQTDLPVDSLDHYTNEFTSREFGRILKLARQVRKRGLRPISVSS
jgi:hypothetical protein